ncbi:heme oxygenase-like protein [Coniophora puteana RWD-64-598 SS2]|uniref:Heme oxygenase-like protein n=1 Tax=Coniophora puteana (strain RWD-64-598) TaxID=741705 RepID=A0A5M3MH89_CONPW|nr:heme oxygenase-like protein [Coniophora puteana RWD-64-598 SS2]EIW78582.1 heme oxygenase-like protein [Coniophora puteana RWD-64-598 SS2]
MASTAVEDTPPLTHHLLSLSTPRPYAVATEHEFLESAGKLTLNADRLAFWLSQDRIYAAHAYPRFIGGLITKIPFESSGKDEEKNRRTLEMLSQALQGVMDEVRFFEGTAKAHGLNSEGWRERKATRDYTAEMARIASLGTLEEGLVFLWAMEKAYLDAWRYVRSLFQQPLTDVDETGKAIVELTTHWTNPGFVQFVESLASAVDECYAGKAKDGVAWKSAEELWARVVELEEMFWPNRGEETTGRL